MPAEYKSKYRQIQRVGADSKPTAYYDSEMGGVVTSDGKFYPTNTPNFVPQGYFKVITPPRSEIRELQSSPGTAEYAAKQKVEFNAAEKAAKASGKPSPNVTTIYVTGRERAGDLIRSYRTAYGVTGDVKTSNIQGDSRLLSALGTRSSALAQQRETRSPTFSDPPHKVYEVTSRGKPGAPNMFGAELIEPAPKPARFDIPGRIGGVIARLEAKGGPIAGTAAFGLSAVKGFTTPLFGPVQYAKSTLSFGKSLITSPGSTTLLIGEQISTSPSSFIGESFGQAAFFKTASRGYGELRTRATTESKISLLQLSDTARYGTAKLQHLEISRSGTRIPYQDQVLAYPKGKPPPTQRTLFGEPISESRITSLNLYGSAETPARKGLPIGGPLKYRAPGGREFGTRLDLNPSEAFFKTQSQLSDFGGPRQYGYGYYKGKPAAYPQNLETVGRLRYGARYRDTSSQSTLFKAPASTRKPSSPLLGSLYGRVESSPTNFERAISPPVRTVTTTQTTAQLPRSRPTTISSSSPAPMQTQSYQESPLGFTFARPSLNLLGSPSISGSSFGSMGIIGKKPITRTEPSNRSGITFSSASAFQFATVQRASQRSRTGQKGTYALESVSRQLPAEDFAQLPRSRQKIIPVSIQNQAPAQMQDQSYRFAAPQFPSLSRRGGGISGIGEPFQPPTPRKISPSLNENPPPSRKSRRRDSGSIFAPAYTPSITALTFNLRGPRSLFQSRTGLGVRNIPLL